MAGLRSIRATASRVRSPPESTPHRFLDVVAGEEKAAEDGTDVGNHVDRGVSGKRLVDRQRRVEARRFVLREVLHHDLVTLRPCSRVRRLHA